MDKKIKEYLKRTEFHLMDFAKTKGLHESYKENIFNDLMKDHKRKIEYHLENLKDNIVYKTREKQTWWKPDLTKIRHIAMLKTSINHVTRKENIDLMEYLLYGNVTNDTFKSRFAIKFYIKYYKKINKIMKEALTEIVKEGI